MTRFEELRQKYPVFRYDRFEFQRGHSGVTGRFHFTIPPDIAFTPEVHFAPVREGWFAVPDAAVSNAVFHLGLIEALSYWKATASPRFEVHAGSLTGEQVQWWADLLIHGMGEFFYRNDIDFTQHDFVKIVSAGSDTFSLYSASLPQRSLLTIGGGRDSALAAGLLRDSGHPFTCMMLNPSSAASRIAAQVTSADPVVIRRSISPGLLELNRLGFLNGHTPFSAYLGFLGVVCLLLYGYSDVIVANERSSDEGNLGYRGREIKQCVADFFEFSAGRAGETVNANSVELNAGGGADLIAYVGHDGLMDFSLDSRPEKADDRRRDAIMLACLSKRYFAEPLRRTGASPLLWTTGLMAPEAYVLKAAIDGWAMNEDGEGIRRRAATAYNQYQRCGMNAALRLFSTGW